jgi:hypothetical protein
MLRIARMPPLRCSKNHNRWPIPPLSERPYDVTFIGKLEYEAKAQVSGVTAHRWAGCQQSDEPLAPPLALPACTPASPRGCSRPLMRTPMPPSPPPPHPTTAPPSAGWRLSRR